LLPIFNGEDTVRRCIDSIKSQTAKNFIVYISDNCSTDNTFVILNDLTKNDSRFKLIRQQENLGVYNNFSYLIKLVKTPYVMYIGADDHINSFFIAEAFKIISDDDSVSMVIPNVIYTDSGYSYHGVSDNNLANSPLLRLINYFSSVTDNGIFYCLTKTNHLRGIMLELLPKLIPNSGGDHFVLASLLIKGKARKSYSVVLFRSVGKASMTQLNKNSSKKSYLVLLFIQSHCYIKNYIIFLRHYKINLFRYLIVLLVIIYRNFFKRPIGVLGSIYIKQNLIKLLKLNVK
jgi:glycosyltransferase involved in cell wall biosynthesis